jgi:uncharacterized membrane protein
VVVLVVWLAVAGFSLIFLGILAYGLFSQLKRLQKTMERAQGELAPMIASLQPDTPQGRHRAG